MNTSLNRHRWLVVDDDPSILEFSARALSGPARKIGGHGSPKVLEISFAEPSSFDLLDNAGPAKAAQGAVE